MKYFCSLTIVLLCLSGIVLFFSTGSAQVMNSSADTTVIPRVTFGFDVTMLEEGEIKDVRAAYDSWMKMMGEKTGFKVQSYIYNDLDALVLDYGRGILDVLSFAPPNYLRLEKKLLNMQPAYTVQIGGKKTRKYLLIVRSDSAFAGIQDLKGKKFAVTKTNKIGEIYLNTLLLRNKFEKANKFFSAVVEKTKYSQAILSVFFGQTDACITADVSLKTMIELNPQVGTRLKVIASSPELVNPIALNRSDLDKKIREGGLKVIFNLQNSAEGRQGLILFGGDRLVPLLESDLDTMRELFTEYNELLKRSKL